MQGSDSAVLVPQDQAFFDEKISVRWDNCGVVFLSYPFNPKLSDRAVSPTTSSRMGAAVVSAGGVIILASWPILESSAFVRSNGFVATLIVE